MSNHLDLSNEPVEGAHITLGLANQNNDAGQDDDFKQLPYAERARGDCRSSGLQE
ncbi:hypothetical protein Y023_5678 [Burkholderia pseudomallei A79D]|nr:hypothetical protein Y023_5678 [Burkholderia pseudomallei A79D]